MTLKILIFHMHTMKLTMLISRRTLIIKKMVRANGTYSYNFNSEPIFIFKKLLSNSNSKYLDFIKNININPLPNNLSFSGNFDRLLNKQKFREINYSGISSNNQIPIPLLVQANYLFKWSMSLSHNLTNSLNLNYNATNDNIINVNNILGTDLKKDDLNLFDDFLNIGDVDYFNQNLTINYSLPLSSIPYLDFIQSSYTYSGNFNWQRGSDILNNVTDSNGIVLGNISTIQNSNNQSIVASLNFDKFYRNFKFLNKKNTLFDVIKGLKRFRINYTENSGKVIPGYTPKIGFFGTSKPTLGFVFEIKEIFVTNWPRRVISQALVSFAMNNFSRCLTQDLKCQLKYNYLKI